MKAKGARRKPSYSAYALIDCTVSAGTFADERSIVVNLPNGQSVLAFVDKSQVLVERDPKDGEEVNGRLRVYVVSKMKDKAIIDLPEAGIAVGPRVEVPVLSLRY
jgi:hypothetical protein